MVANILEKDLKTAHIFQKDNRITRLIKETTYIKVPGLCVGLVCIGLFLSITTSALRSGDQFLLTSGLIKTTSTCYNFYLM